MKKIRRVSGFLAIVVVSAILTAPAPGVAQQDDTFAVPQILENNVVFWKAIYTSISLGQGLLHDREYPLIIYDTIEMGDNGRSSSRQVGASRERIEAAIGNVRTLPVEQWGDLEKNINAMFDTYAPPGAIDSAKERMRFQLGQKERFLKGLERSGMYIDTIRSIFAQYNIPSRIAFLPHVESSFDYKAYSKVGAAGLWQFMRYTGRSYLKINYLVDERLDPILETYAAAKLLSYNFSEIQSWPLAITAYNHGLNGMRRAVESTGSRDIGVIIQRHQSPSFKFASKNFYSCFLAASEIAADPARYFPQVNYQPKAQYREMTMTHFIRPDVISRVLGVDESVIRELNPALRPVVFQHQKPIPEGYVLHIPVSVPVERAVALVENKIPDSLKQDAPQESQYYRVQRGDNLSVIAGQFGVSPAALALENDISTHKKIYAGQMLLIPSKGVIKTDSVVAVAGVSEPVPPPHALEEKGEAPAVAPVQRPVPAPTRLPIRKQIADTLQQILAVTADTIVEPVRSARPTVQNRSQMARFDVEIYALESILSPDGSSVQITVSVDETVGHYCDWAGISTQTLHSANTIGSRGSIRIGRRLKIPLRREGALAAFSRARLEYHMALEEDFYSRYKVTDVRSHIITRGETLWDICGEDEIPLWLFKKHNKHLDLGTLMPGTTVGIPVIEEKTEQDARREASGDRGVDGAGVEPVRWGTGGLGVLP